MSEFNINNYLTYRDNKAIFTGNKLTVYVPKYYETPRLLTVADTVTTLGVFEFRVNEAPDTHGLFLPAIITMSPSTITYPTIGGVDYCQCEFTKGDVFLNQTTLVRNSYLAYVMFEMFVHQAKLPKFVTYQDTAFIFDIIKRVTKSKMNVNHAVFEMLFSHLCRDQDDLFKYYRLTNMERPPKLLKLNDAAHATMTTTAKLIGGYLDDAINGVLVNPDASSTPSDIEDLLRS